MSRITITFGSSTSSIRGFLDLEYGDSLSNVTSLLMSIFLNVGKYIQYAFELSLYPMNIPFLPDGLNLVLLSFGMCLYNGKTNILRLMTSSFSLK